VGWYDLKTGERLPVAGSSQTALEITGLEVKPAPSQSVDNTGLDNDHPQVSVP